MSEPAGESSVRVREMKEEDAEEVNVLVAQLGYPNDLGKTQTAIRAVLGSEIAGAFVAEDPSGRVIGCGPTYSWRLHRVGRTPSWRAGGARGTPRIGRGRALLDRVEAGPRARGAGAEPALEHHPATARQILQAPRLRSAEDPHKSGRSCSPQKLSPPRGGTMSSTRGRRRGAGPTVQSGDPPPEWSMRT